MAAWTQHPPPVPRDVWLRLLTAVGFAAKMVIEETTEDRTPRDIFVARRLTPSTRRRARSAGPRIWCGQAQTFRYRH
jgi:hypothetical protein